MHSFGPDTFATLFQDVSCTNDNYLMLFQCSVSTTISSSCITNENDISVTCCKCILIACHYYCLTGMINAQPVMNDEKTITVNRVDALVMRQLKIFKMIALKLQALSHITTHLIIAASTLLQQKYEHPFSLYF